MVDPRQTLRDNEQFQAMPERMQSWILASPHAVTNFSDFFEKEGMIDFGEEIGLSRYVPRDPPRIAVDRSTWVGLQQPGTEWGQRAMFGQVAHEIEHDRFNTGTVPFTGRAGEEYVQYRAGLERPRGRARRSSVDAGRVRAAGFLPITLPGKGRPFTLPELLRDARTLR